jgi:hypothetical protein
MAKVFTGRDGRLLLGSSQLAKVTTWSLESSVEMLEITTLGENLRSFTPGIQGFTGSASLIYYKDDNGRNDASTLLQKLVRTGTGGVTTSDLVTLTLRLADGGSNRDVTFDAYITSATIGASVGEIVAAQISFQVTGALTGASI